MLPLFTTPDSMARLRPAADFRNRHSLPSIRPTCCKQPWQAAAALLLALLIAPIADGADAPPPPAATAAIVAAAASVTTPSPPFDPAFATHIQALLDNPDGWTLHSEKDRVLVYQKAIDEIGLTAYMGRMVLAPEVTPDDLFATLGDVEHHPDFNSLLVDSRRLYSDPGRRDFCQVMKGPRLVPIAKRYWFNRSFEQRDIDGERGHHRSTWMRLPEDAYPEARREIGEKYRGAVELPLTFGSWECLPLGGSYAVTFRTVSDPGGSIPKFLVNWATRRALPENMLLFEKAAAERGRTRRSSEPALRAAKE
jgi:hypothetical protein